LTLMHPRKTRSGFLTQSGTKNESSILNE
jgi:hypothetical protein